MNRVFLKKSDRDSYFKRLRQSSDLTFTDLAKEFHISKRSLYDWRRGINSFPLSVAIYINKKYQVNLPQNSVIKKESTIKAKSGKKGAIIRNQKHGNPGTIEGRKKGGRNSINTHKRLKTGFKIEKRLPTIRESNKLAELFGIILGDGSISKAQIRISLNALNDQLYAIYVNQLIFNVLKEYASVANRGNVIELTISSTQLVKKFNRKGLVIGNKVKQKIRIPKWIKKNDRWIRHTLRGMFDTDGSVYLDKHYKQDKDYQSICIAFTSFSPPLLKEIYDYLESQNYHPTKSSKYRIMVRRRNEVLKFFNSVKPANEKHKLKLRKFMEE